MRPNEVARTAQKSEGSRKSGGKEKAAAIKVGKDSGRVKVFVRVRPLKSQEVAKKEKVAVEVSELSSSIHVSDPKHSYEKDFPFDHVFPSGSTNHEVCNTLCKPIVTSALNGFNGTLMAYGQTGSGKTYTLMAPDGIAAGVVDRCFKRIMHDAKHDYKVSMSYLQIYQEKIYDLLNSTNKVDLNIREHPQKGVYVENLSEFVVRTPSEVMNLLAVGKKRLVFAETKMNRTSSRSHSVCMLLIERTLSKEEEGKPKDCVPNEKKSPSKEPRANSLLRRTGSPKKTLATSSSISETPSEAEEEDEQDSLAKMTFTDDVLVRGRIHLCDLAGSERLKKTGAEGERLSEAQHINLSLLELGNVIHALADGSKTHVPFRNSTLTRLLQESLGGNCKTSLIVCVSPTMTDVSETKSTLYFGSRAMKITNTAYVNVEVDYKKLSDDLTKILNTRDKDLEDLKESYESRIEKVKMEAESQINSSMLSAQEVLSSVRSLFDSKEQELKNELQQVDEELQREKQLSSELREHLSSLGGCLSGGVNRTKSALLAELLSMQLFYALQGMPEQEREHLAREMQGEYLYSGEKLLGVREKVLENTDNVLQILECYLKQQNREGLENSGLNLRDLETALMNGDQIHSRVPIESSGLNSEHRELSWNKTDDDKVMESDKCHNNDQESNKSKFLNLTKQLRSKLVGIKDSLDGDAIEFLKKAFALDGDNNEDRKKVYNAMVEFLLHRKSHEDKTHDSSSVTMLNTEMALLDQSLCHVIVDKALQSSILLLEQSEVQRRCTQLSENNRNLNKELEVMRLQVETLVVENNKLNSKLSETSNFLQDVKSSKEMLENDLSSVFQLYNMRSPEHKLNNGGLTKDASSDLKDGLSTLVEENAKLKLELKDTQEEKRDLQMQLKKAKEKLQKLSKELETKNIPSFSSKSTQTDNLSSLNNKNTENHSGKVLNCEEKNSKENPVQLSNGENQESQGDGDDETSKKKAVSKKLVDIEQFLINLQDELIKLEDDESALFSHANQRQLVSSLRLNLNKRLGELWSIEVVESKTLRARVDELTIKLESAAFDYEKQIEELESELHNESQARLNLENELLQYRKEVMDLGEEIWKMCHKESEVKDAPNIEKASSVTKYAKNVPQDEVDSRRRLSSSSLSLSRCNSDDSLHEVSKRKVDLRLVEIDAKRAKEEFEDLKHSFLQLNRDLADSGKARQEMEEKFVKLANENNAITLRFQAAEDNNKALEEKIGHVSALKTTLQDELIKLKEAEHSHMEDIRGYKEKIANYEVEKTRLKHDLSKTEIKFTTLDNKYKEMNSDLIEAKKCLKEAQMRLKTKEQEVKDLHEAYDRLRSHIVPDDSDRESLVEVKMKQNGRRDSATPSRIQSIHLVSRAKSPSTKKKQPMYLAAKKKMSIKRSPRNDENSPRKSTLKRGTLGKRETLTSDGESRTFTRGESDRDTIKRSKRHEKRTLKRNNDEDQKLKSELLLAKEQLLRLKGELTLSNIQTANLGTHLTSLREDSNKLEVELSSLRRPPGSKEDPTIFEGNKHAISELDSAKEKIIGLQDDILALRRETSAGEEKLTKCEEEANQLRSELYKTRDGLERSQEVVKILNKEIELLETKNQILQHRLTAYACKESETHIAEKDGMPSGGESSINTVQLAQFEQDKARLEKEVEQLSNEKTKLEDMQNLVQQLVEIEDEQALLKSRLRKAVKKAAKNDEIEEKTINPNNENDKPSRKVKSSQISNKVPDQNTEKKLEEYYVENTALRCEVDALRIYISNLENENKTVKFKLSISESSQSNTDKKVLATLLASAKHEREELRETLNGVYSEKEDMEEALNVARIKSERLQRELMQVSQSRTQLEKELHVLKNDMQIPEKEKTPSTSLTMEEKSIVDLVRKFLNTVGSRNVKERDIKDFARTLLARKIHLNGKNPKPMGMDSRQPWKSSSSIHRNSIRRDSPGNSSKAEAATVNRTGMLTNISPAKTTDSSKANSTSGLRRYKPGTDRGTPEGMEVQHQSTTAKSKHDIKIFNSTAKIDNLQSRRPSKEVKDDLSLIYLDIDSKGDTAADSEVLIKRAWSLKDLFKRNSSNGKAQKNPSVINQ